MNIQEALDMADQMKPNMMPRETKIRFLSELDGIIYEELVMKHEHTAAEAVKPAYDNDTDDGTELIMPAPYDMIYAYWLMSKIDLLNMEMDKYNNDRALFDNAYGTASDWWTRERMPIPQVREFTL